MGGKRNGDKGGGESDVDDHHFSVASTKLLGALALVAVIIGIGIGYYVQQLPPPSPQIPCTRLQVPNGHVSLNEMEKGGTVQATIFCKEGFTLKGKNTLTCTESGKWDGEVPNCIAMKCPDLENPLNGRVNVKKQALDSTAKYKCNEGFVVNGGDRVRKCLTGGGWSGKAPLCKFGGEDKVAYTIQRKMNHLQEIAWSLKGQNNISKALEDISSNLAKSKLQAGMVGFMKSGKSSVLNALMRSATLPVAVQAETAVEVRIIHSTKPKHRNGVLFGETDDHSYKVIAKGSDNIHEKLQKFNKSARNKASGNESTGEALPYKSFVLRTPFPFLGDFKMRDTLQISDTPTLNEAGVLDGITKNKEAMKRLSAFIIVLNYRTLKDQGEIHLLTHLRDHHSHLMEAEERFLFLVNAIDAYHEEAHGDKYSIHPQDVPRYVQKYLKDNLGVEVPVEFIVPFSAKWALKSHLWSENPTSMSDVKYFSAMQVYCKFQGIVPPKRLRIPNEHNKVLVLIGLKLFSKIGELEAKLYQMLGNHGPEFLYKGAIDDAVLHVSALTEHIEKEKVNCNIGPTQTDLQLHKNIKEELDTGVAANKERRPKIPLEVDMKITTQVISWTNELMDSIYDKMLSLKLNEQNVEMIILKLKEHNLKKQILETAENKMKNHWPQIMGTTIGIVKEETHAMVSAFKRDIEERVGRFDGIELEIDEIDLAQLEPLSPPFTLVLSVSPNTNLNNTMDMLWDLAVDLAVQFQEKVRTEATKLSFTTAGQAERAAQQSLSRFRQKIQKEILRLTDELESKQGFIESLNQKLNELQTISDQLKGAQNKIEKSLFDEIPTDFGEEIE